MDGNTSTPEPTAGKAPLFGRTAEFVQLVSQLDGVVDGGRASAVLLVGQCGVGKSRLLSEVALRAERSDVLVLRGKCIGRGAEPLLPVRDALGSYLGSTPQVIKQVIMDAAPHLLGFVPFIGHFLVPIADAVAGGPKLGGSSVDGVYAGLEQVFQGLAQRKGLCLVIEDIHDADTDTLYFVNYLLIHAAETRALVLCSVDQDELEEPLLAGTVDNWVVQGWTRVNLGALPKDRIADYVTTASGETPSQPQVDALFELTDGNALLLKELLPLVRSGTTADLQAELSNLTLPERVHAVLNRRLAPLEKDLRTFLEGVAICLENTQDFGVVAPILEVDEDLAFDLLDQCSRKGLLTEASSGEVRFVPGAMRLAIYGSVPEGRRRRLHGKAAEWYDANGQASAAAHHFGRAGRTDDMVRSALRAAAVAEHIGMYHSAVTLYEQASAHGARAEVGTRFARALIMLGRWGEAEDLLRGLSADDPTVRLVWSELHFVQGQIRTAADEIVQTLPHADGERLDCLFRLADIFLYLGDFAQAKRYSDDGAALAEQTGSVNERARGLGIAGALSFFAGDVLAAENQFQTAYELLLAVPEEERNRTRFTVILGNLGQTSEARGDWERAERLHTQALEIRREVFDARGVLQSLHAVARARIGGSEIERAAEPLEEAERLAMTLGEPLERAKLALTRAKLALGAGATERAVLLGKQAREGFIACGTAFDVTHARLALSEIFGASGQEWDAVSEAASAREAIDRNGFGLLRLAYPQLSFSYPERIAAALCAYTGGDAFGLPWEGSPPAKVELDTALTLPARPGWERGATSDDTALTLLAAEVLLEAEAADPESRLARRFLELLSERADDIPGLGPSTLAAVANYRETHDLPLEGGNTNGAVMRALPVGWLVPLGQPGRRRGLTIEMSRATHPSPEATSAACVMSACASWALEGASGPLLMQVATDEARAAGKLCGTDDRLEILLTAVATGGWSAGASGVDLDPYNTVAAVMSVVSHAETLSHALESAIALGGDTDTVAALVGGIVGSRLTVSEVEDALPWIQEVQRPERSLIRTISENLAAARARAADG